MGSDPITDQIPDPPTIDAQASRGVPSDNTTLTEVLERYDAILTPAAPGEAPAGLGSTGNPAFNTLWSLCGMPAVSLPLLTGPTGLPVGVQLVGRRGDDARLLRAAAWLARALGGANATVTAYG